MSLEEILDQCVLQIRQKLNDEGVIFERRCWKPSQIGAGDLNLDVFPTVKRTSSEISGNFCLQTPIMTCLLIKLIIFLLFFIEFFDYLFSEFRPFS